MVFHCPWLSACDAALSSSQAKAFIQTTAGFPKREATAANFLKLRASKSQSILANLSYWTSWVTGPDWMWEVENRGVHRKGWISTGRILVLSTTYLQSHLAHVVRTGYVSGPSKLQPRNSYRIHIVDGCSVIKGKEIQMYDVPCMKPAHTRQSVSCRFTCLRCVERTTLRRSRGDWWLHMLGEDAMLTGNKHGRCYWGDENALKLDYAEMVTHFNVFIKNCWIVLLEAGNLMVCKSIFQ